VRNSQGTYIAIDGNYQYHVSDQALAVYQVKGGSYDQLEGEDVIRHERFLY
jgi:regulator of protease activity HflC (stomatin/prohibitin superfamily)